MTSPEPAAPRRRLPWPLLLAAGLYAAGLAWGLAALRGPGAAWEPVAVAVLHAAGLALAVGSTLRQRLGPAAGTAALLAVAVAALAVPWPFHGLSGGLAAAAAAWAAVRARPRAPSRLLVPGLLLAGALARVALELVAPAWIRHAPAATGGALALAALAGFRGGILTRPLHAAAFLAALVIAAFGARVYGHLRPDAQTDLGILVLLAGFIAAAILLAAAFTRLFVAALDHLAEDPVLAFLLFLPVLALPAGVLGWSWSDAGPFVPLGARALPVSVPLALDAVLALGALAVLGVRAAARRIGVRSPVMRVAWKFLRSQRLELTPGAHRVNRLRELVPREPSPGPRPGALPSRAALLAGTAAFLAWVLWPGAVPAEPLRVEALAAALAVAALALAAAGLRRPGAAPGSVLADLLPAALALAVALLARPELDAGPLPFPHAKLIPPVAAAGAAVLLAGHAGLRWHLGRRQARGLLPAALQPALAPSLDNRLRRGVGLSMFVAVVGVAVGVWALIVVLSVMRGFSSDLTAKIVQSREHLVVRATDDLTGIPDPLALARRLRGLPEVRSASAYVEANVMLTSSSNIGIDITLRGVDAERYAGGELAGQVISGSARFLREPDRLAPPAYLAESPWPAEEEAPTPVPAPGGPPPVPGPGAIPMTPIPGVGDAGTAAPAEVVLPPVLVGLELAGSLGLEVGGQVELIAPDGEAGPAGLQPKSRSFRVAGLITTGLYDYDMKLVYTTLGEAQRFLGLEDSVNRVEARLEDLEDAGAVAATAAGWLDPERCTVDDWKRMNRNLFSALELEWVVMFLVLGFVVLIASFSILSSLLMIIRQRTGAISILRCMGFRLRDLGRVFLVLGALVGLLGSLSGLLLGLSSCVLLGDLGLPLPGEYYIRVLPVDLEPGAVAIIVVASWLLTVVASIYPARRASRTNLLEGLYDER